MRTRGCRIKPIGEILRFVGHQSFAEFHDAHRVRWDAVIGKYEFSDPEIAAADNSPHRKTLLVWLDESTLLNVVPAADPLARLRIIKHGILAVDFMFDLEIARVRSIPMALQRHPHGSIVHLNLPHTLPAIVSGPLNSLCCTLKRGALLPIAPVVCRLTMRAIAVWSKDTPVGSPRQCADLVGQRREELLASIWASGLIECRLWVIRVGLTEYRRLPLYPSNQTS